LRQKQFSFKNIFHRTAIIKLSKNVLSYFILSGSTLPGKAVDLSLDTVKQITGDGGKNRFKLEATYLTSDGDSCNESHLCEGLVLKSMFDPKGSPVCVECSGNCDSLKLVATFDKEWAMIFIPL